MNQFLTWLSSHGADFVEAAGIIASLAFTAAAFRSDARSRRLANLMALTDRHRQIWSEARGNPLLGRVKDAAADTAATDVTKAESAFVVTLIQHLYFWYRADSRGEMESLEGLSRDVASFFSLPVPAKVWEEKKQFYDGDFVRFVDASLAASTPAARGK